MTKTKNKKIIIAACVAASVVIAVVAGIFLHNPLQVKEDALTVEFGQKISTDAADYLADDVDKDIVKNTKVTYKADPVEGADYDKCGEYLVTLSYENKSAEVTVNVQDTVKPEFNATAEAGIETIEGVELKFEELITASDLSGAEVKFEASGVDLNTAGEYILKVTAKDGQGNKAKKDIKVTVTAKPANMTRSEVSVDASTGKVTVKAQTAAKSSGSSGGSAGSGSSGGSSSGNSNSIPNPPTTSSGTIPGSGNTWEESDWIPLPEGW